MLRNSYVCQLAHLYTCTWTIFACLRYKQARLSLTLLRSLQEYNGLRKKENVKLRFTKCLRVFRKRKGNQATPTGFNFSEYHMHFYGLNIIIG